MDKSAVFTGDLIGSTLVPPEVVDRAMMALSGASMTISRWAGTDTRFTRFRGDGWQMYLPDCALILRATLLVLAKLKSEGGGLSTWLSIGVGSIDRLGESGLSEASGEAFTLSGRNLDQKVSFQTFVYAEPGQTDHWKSATLSLAVWQAQQWTPEQAEAVALALDLPRPPDAILAQRLAISRQAFQSRLKGSGLMAASNALLAFEISRAAQEATDA